MAKINMNRIKKIINKHQKLIEFLEEYIKGYSRGYNEDVILKDYYLDVLKENLDKIQFIVNNPNNNNINFNEIYFLDMEYERLKKEIFNDKELQDDERFNLLAKKFNNAEQEQEF